MRSSLFWIAAFLPLLVVLWPAVTYLLSLNLPLGPVAELAAATVAAGVLLKADEQKASGSAA